MYLITYHCSSKQPESRHRYGHVVYECPVKFLIDMEKYPDKYHYIVNSIKITDEQAENLILNISTL